MMTDGSRYVDVFETDKADTEKSAKAAAESWNRLCSSENLVSDVPQVGMVNMPYKAEGDHRALPGTIRGVRATDDEGLEYMVTLFDSPSMEIPLKLSDRSKRLRRVQGRSSKPAPMPQEHTNRGGADYISGT